MKTLIIGANGQIGRLFCCKAHLSGFPLRAMVREPGQAAWFREQGIETVVANLEGDFLEALHGCDQVVFSAGAGGSVSLLPTPASESNRSNPCTNWSATTRFTLSAFNE